jgi:hypothetical protein
MGRETGQAMTLQRIGWIVLTVVLLVWVVRNPDAAATAVQTLGHYASQAADALSKAVGH